MDKKRYFNENWKSRTDNEHGTPETLYDGVKSIFPSLFLIFSYSFSLSFCSHFHDFLTIFLCGMWHMFTSIQMHRSRHTLQRSKEDVWCLPLLFFTLPYFYFLIVLGIEPRSLHMLVQCSTTELPIPAILTKSDTHHFC